MEKKGVEILNCIFNQSFIICQQFLVFILNGIIAICTYMRSCGPPYHVCKFIDLFFVNSQADESRCNFVIWKVMNSALRTVKVFIFFSDFVFPLLSYVRIFVLTVACFIGHGIDGECFLNMRNLKTNKFEKMQKNVL